MRVEIETDDIVKYGYIKAYILGILRKQPEITTKELMEYACLQETALSKHLRDLIVTKKVKAYRFNELGLKKKGSGGYNAYAKFEVAK